MRLAPKLTILFLLIAIVPTAIVGYLAYNNSRQTIVQETIEHLVSINLFKNNELKRWVEGNKSSIEELAQRPLVRQYAAVLAKHDTPDPEYHKARRSIVEDHLKATLKYGGFFELFLMCPRHGLISASTNEKQEGKYRDTYPYFIEGKSHTYIQGIYYSRMLEQPAMTMSTPIKNKKGNLMGVLAGRLDLRELSKIISLQTGGSPTEDTYLVNTFNFFVTEPRFGQGYALKKAVRTEGVEAGLSGKDGVGSYKDYRGVPVIGAYKWLPEYSMCIISEIDQAEAFAPIVDLAWAIAGIASAISIAAGLMGVFFTRTITRPVQQLAEGAEEIGGGNLEHRVGTASKDEIGGLSRAFDRMTENLKATMVSRDVLAQSEERFRLAAESSTDLIYEWDIKESVDYFGKIDELLGYGPSEFPRTLDAWANSVHPDDRDRVMTAVKNHLEKDEPYDIEYRVQKKDGTYNYWWARGTAVRDKKGNPYRWIGAVTDITERKQAEETLASHNRIADVFLTVPDDEMYHEVLKVILEVMQSPYGVFGYIDDVGSFVVPSMTRHIWDKCQVADKTFTFPRDTWGDSSWPRAIREKKTNYTNEVSTRTPEGHIDIRRHVSLPIVFQDEVIGLIQVANKGTDYTKADIRSLETIAERIAPILSARLQRKRAEEEVSKLNAELEQRVLERTAQLRSARERLQFVLSATPAVIYTSKASGDYAATFISDNIAQLGYTPVEFLENPDFWVSHIHPDDAPRVLADLAHLFEHGHHIHEYRFRLKDGSYRWMRDELHLVRDEDGNPLETVGYWIDITERKQAEEALAASEGKYRGLYDSLRDGIVMVSMDGRITQCNRVYREMLGYTEEEVLRLTYQQLTPQKWHAMEAEIVRDQIVARGYSDEYEKEYIRKDGTAFPISLHVWLITDEQGETTGMWGIIRDITERKRAEDELRRLNRDLALRAAELDAVNQELEAFAYSVSHDLRSPLRVVDGYSKILLEDYCGKLDEDGRFMLGQVRESVHQMGQLIDDLLAFSRMSRREMTRRQCDIGAMARQVFRALREAHPNRRLALTVQPLPAAFGEPAMIREVLRNLLDNAVKFTATREEGVIEMGSMPIADGQSEIAYYVRDNGVGFDMRYRNKLFQVFQRLHRTEDFDGTGIGLALVARIVHRHGGRVWAEGEEDKGATFYFTLPRTADAEDKGLKTIGEERT